jgi:Holliday junction resolvase RusA-like endonuclease
MTRTSEVAAQRELREVLVWLVGNAEGEVLQLRIDAEPVPESLQCAARFGRAVMFKGKRYAQYLAECVKQLSKQRPADGPLTGDLMAVFEIILTKPKTTVKERPKGDWDNLTKGPQDAVTQAKIWDDDDSVISAFAVKRWAAKGEEPGVNIWIGKLP